MINRDPLHTQNDNEDNTIAKSLASFLKNCQETLGRKTPIKQKWVKKLGNE